MGKDLGRQAVSGRVGVVGHIAGVNDELRSDGEVIDDLHQPPGAGEGVMWTK